MNTSQSPDTLKEVLSIVGNAPSGRPLVELYRLSKKDLDNLAFVVASLDNSLCFPEACLQNVSLTGHLPLIKETTARTFCPFDPSDAIYHVLANGEHLTEKKQLEVCKFLLPLAPASSLPHVLDLAVRELNADVVEYTVNNFKVDIEPEDHYDLLVEALSRVKSYPKRCAHIIDLLLKNKKDLFDEPFDGVLRCAMEASASSVKQVIPFVAPSCIPKTLCRFLQGNKLREMLENRPNEEFKDIVELLYEKSKYFFVSLTMEQLDVFLPKDDHPYFWELHTQFSLQHDLEKSVEKSVKKAPSRPEKKM